MVIELEIGQERSVSEENKESIQHDDTTLDNEGVICRKLHNNIIAIFFTFTSTRKCSRKYGYSTGEKVLTGKG